MVFLFFSPEEFSSQQHLMDVFSSPTPWGVVDPFLVAKGPLCNGGGVCWWWHQQVIHLSFKKAEGRWVCIIVDVNNLFFRHLFCLYAHFTGCNRSGPFSSFTCGEGEFGISLLWLPSSYPILMWRGVLPF